MLEFDLEAYPPVKNVLSAVNSRGSSESTAYTMGSGIDSLRPRES